MKENATVTIGVYDVLGNKIETLINEAQDSGNHLIDYNAKNRAKGIYLVVVSINGQAFTKRIVLTN